MRKEQSKWRLTEKVVVLLEKSLTPDSNIEHDVELPDLTGDSDTRQCDIIIRSGRYPRETITLVEVQDRTKKFDITFFDGLYEKMKKIGAQHLICVSTKGFPKSIVNRANRIGPTVRLVTLRELKENKFPLNIIGQSISIIDTNINEISKIKMSCRKEDIHQIQESDRNFTSTEIKFIYNDTRYTFNDLVKMYIERTGIKLEEGKNEIKISLPFLNEKLFNIKNNNLIEIKLISNVVLERTTQIIPITFSDYKQIGINEPLAWLMEAKGVYKGKDFSMKATFIAQEFGGYLTSWEIPAYLNGVLDIKSW